MSARLHIGCDPGCAVCGGVPTILAPVDAGETCRS